MALSFRCFSNPLPGIKKKPLPIICKATSSSSSSSSSSSLPLTSQSSDAMHVKRAAKLADKSAGLTAPHPNFGCVIAAAYGGVVGEGYLYAEGTKPAELQAVEAAGDRCRGAYAYLNMEPGDCHSDHTAVSALVKAGISRVVIGIRHPSQHLRGTAIRALRSEGLQVDVLGEELHSKTIEVHAFVAPKIIGGKNAPTPVGELGMVEMTQALELHDVLYEQIGPDMLVSGFLQPVPDVTPVIPSIEETSAIDPSLSPYESSIIFFYKTWDPYGAFSNFSPHPITMPDENGAYFSWPSVEHYYQAHKFVEVNDPAAISCFEDIKCVRSPEEAARLGRRMQRQHPDLVRSDWEDVKIDVMYQALKCKFSIYPHLNSMLLSTAGSVLVEASPHDFFWGGGRDGEGLNYLGRLLMQLRLEFLGETSISSEAPITSGKQKHT